MNTNSTINLDSDHDIFVFLCGNKRTSGAFCGSNEHDDDFDSFRKLINRYKPQLKHRVKLNKTGCLGRCGDGANLVIFPDNIWYKYQTYEDLEEIFISQILNKKPISRLLQVAA